MNHRRETGYPTGYCTGTGGAGAAYAYATLLGWHSSSKRWCESLQDEVLGPGTLEKGWYGLRRPGCNLGFGVQGLEV